MVVCNFFLQGRCRYGEKCWNEHPRGGSRGGGGFNDSYSRSGGQQQQQRPPRGGGGGGGFGNRVWVNPSQQRGGYIQPSTFSSQGSSDWGPGHGGGGGRRENVKSSDFSFSSPNQFSALNTSNAFDRGGGGGGAAGAGTAGDEDDDKKLEVIQMDMDAWESSGQWGFSCYSYFKTAISGFTDLSPEELRLEYYTQRASGDLQGYLNGINQLLSQWKSRVQELKLMNPSTRLALLAELNGTAPQSTSTGFGCTSANVFGLSTSRFGSKGFSAPAPAQSFGLPASSTGFASSSTSSPATGFGGLLAAPTQPPSGFGSSSAPSASSFSFAGPSADKPAATSVFGSSTAPSAGGAFGSTFGAAAAASPAAEAAAAGEAEDGLFSAESKLTQEELNQFKAKRFTLGQIPLKPPPVNMLVV